MGGAYPTVRAAAVQAAAVFLDRERTTAKACEDGGASTIGSKSVAPAWKEASPSSRRSLLRWTTRRSASPEVGGVPTLL